METKNFLTAVQSGETSLVKSDFFAAATTQAVMGAFQKAASLKGLSESKRGEGSLRMLNEMHPVRERVTLATFEYPKRNTGVALLMAGGKSERMRAGGCDTHKALRKVGGRSLLQQNLETLIAYGFTEVTVAVNRSEQDLLTAVSDLQPLATSKKALLRIVEETQPLGTMGAAGFMSHFTDDLLVFNADNVTDLDLNAFFAHHLQSNAALTVACHFEPFRIPFGQLEVSESRVLACKEKPLIPVLVSSGIYALGKRALTAILPNQKTQAPDLMNSLIAAGESVAYFQHNARWIDVNDEGALAAAEAEFARPLRAMPASA